MVRLAGRMRVLRARGSSLTVGEREWLVIPGHEDVVRRLDAERREREFRRKE
jgi:hypothetical protein